MSAPRWGKITKVDEDLPAAERARLHANNAVVHADRAVITASIAVGAAVLSLILRIVMAVHG